STSVARLPLRLRTIAGISLAGLALNGTWSSAVIADRMAEGEGFADRSWRESETLAHLRSAPPARVFTNGPEVVAALVGGDVSSLPTWASRVSLERSPAFESEMEALCRATREGSKVVYLEAITWTWEVPSAQEVQDACGLRLERRFSDGIVLARDP